MDLEFIILSEESQRERQISYAITYLWNLKKMIQMNLFTKQKQIHRHRKQTYVYQKGKGTGVGRDKLGIWDEHKHTTMYKVGKQQGPTVQHREQY